MNASCVYANKKILCSFVYAPVPTGDQNILSAHYFEWIILLKERVQKYSNQGRDRRQNHGFSNNVHVLIPRTCDCCHMAGGLEAADGLEVAHQLTSK